MTTIRIADDLSKTPSGRYRKAGTESGKELREKLVAALKKNDDVTVVLDGTEGYGSSFLEEAFGGLVRLKLFSVDDIRKRLKIVAETPEYSTYEDEAKSYIDNAASNWLH